MQGHAARGLAGAADLRDPGPQLAGRPQLGDRLEEIAVDRIAEGDLPAGVVDAHAGALKRPQIGHGRRHRHGEVFRLAAASAVVGRGIDCDRFDARQVTRAERRQIRDMRQGRVDVGGQRSGRGQGTDRVGTEIAGNGGRLDPALTPQRDQQRRCRQGLSAGLQADRRHLEADIGKQPRHVRHVVDHDAVIAGQVGTVAVGTGTDCPVQAHDDRRHAAAQIGQDGAVGLGRVGFDRLLADVPAAPDGPIGARPAGEWRDPREPGRITVRRPVLARVDRLDCQAVIGPVDHLLVERCALQHLFDLGHPVFIGDRRELAAENQGIVAHTASESGSRQVVTNRCGFPATATRRKATAVPAIPRLSSFFF